MGFPTLKYPRLCRLLSYVVVLGAFGAPIIVAVHLPFLSDLVKLLLFLGFGIGMTVYMVREFPVLMSMDLLLAHLSCLRTARTQYTLPAGCREEKILHRLARFGKAQESLPLEPRPATLRYRLSAPWTVYSQGIEKVVAAYRTDCLDADTYRDILRSGRANSKALTGRKKPLFLDRNQKKSPLHRVTVVLIFARQVDPRLQSGLYDLICRQSGDEWEQALLPCIIDLGQGICVFSSDRLPYVGLGYPVKNRGLRLIRRIVFGGRLPLAGNTHLLPQCNDANGQSLWTFWKELREEFGLVKQKTARRLEAMADREIRVQEDTLYLRWGKQGIALEIRQQADTKTVLLDTVTHWVWPKAHPIAKKTIREIEGAIRTYYQASGWSVLFQDPFTEENTENNED